jgi:ABC-type oligopeptide transport system substrate-binding subunit/class 3 adenylate cyclase
LTERNQLEEVISSLEAQRDTLGNAVVDAMIAAARKEVLGEDLTGLANLSGLQGERKLVTIMFADISGFTALAETMDPEAVRDLMNACFEQLVPVVERYEGTVDKFIGDEIMALFGAPVVHENDPERALRAALEMVDALAEFNAEHSTELGLHFGINTGLVIAGGLGTRERQEYSVMGDAVNLAARLENASERGEILVGPDTHRLAKSLFEFEALEPMRVKGKAEPVPVYRLLAAKAVPGQVRGVAGLESPLVGREAEFQALREAVERLQAGAGGIVTLMGEAGLGKSRLVAELREESANPQWVEGRCLSYGTSIAYLLWLDVLRGLLGVTAEDPPVAARDKLREQVELLCPGQVEAIYPYLTRLMSLPVTGEDETALRDLEGEKIKTGTFRAVESLLESAAWKRSLVAVCEDLHWADPTSIELMEELLPVTDRAPLLLLCVFRPETEHGCWHIRETAARRLRHRHTNLWLDPLSTAESEALVGHLLRAERLPVELRDRILGHAEGNPFYVEEIIRSLMDSGVIACNEASGRWQATRDVADIAIPDTLHGVLVARIDRLQEETKRVLQLAAVVGRVFLYHVLAEFARKEQELDGHLLTLQREEMIRERARLPELEYIFKHHLTQEAAYNGLLKKERRLYHRQVAEALGRLFPERVEEQLGLLAHHWERAGAAEKATEYLLRAGDQARMAYAHREAIDYYQRALKILKEREELERAARTLMKLGLTFHTAFEFRRARRAYQEGFALWQRAGERQEGISPAPASHALRVNSRYGDPLSLDPTLPNDLGSGLVIRQLFSGLVELSPELDIVPDVARSWEVSEGGRRYLFHLRDDVRWSDGRQVTAGDFEYAWKRVLDPTSGSRNAGQLYDVKGARAFHRGEAGRGQVGVRALDEATLAVDLEGPTGYFLHLLTAHNTYPLPRHVVEAQGEAWTEVGKIVSNGPFRLEGWRRGKSLLLARNQKYHGRFRGNVQQVEVSTQVDRSATLESYEADGLDVLDLLVPTMDRAPQRHPEEYVTAPRLFTSYVGFNVSRPPFDDRRVRRALALATDRERLADVVLPGHVSPATGGFIPPGMPGHSPGISLPYDPEAARHLLAEAGYPGGRGFPALDCLTRISPVYDLVCKYLEGQWLENLGIGIAWQQVEWGRFQDRMSHDRITEERPQCGITFASGTKPTIGWWRKPGD